MKRRWLGGIIAVWLAGTAAVQVGCTGDQGDPAARAQLEQELQELRQANAELQRLRAENQELARLRRDNEELQRLRQETEDLAALRTDNDQLRGQLQALKAPKPRR